MPESPIISWTRTLYRRFAGPDATLSSIPLACLRAVRGNYATARINGYVLKVDLRDTVISFQILFQRRYEPRQTDLLRKLARSGDFVLDVGGNIGYYTMLLGALVAPTGRVIAIEANAENAALLRENVELNDLDGIVSVVSAAAGAAPGTATLYRVNVGNRGDSRLFDDPSAGGRRSQRELVPVRMTTLDECTSSWPRVDLAKIDVQGYELQVLSGMERVLASNPGLILVTEFWPWGLRQAGTEPGDFLARLTAHGFCLLEVPEEEPLRPIDSAIISQLDAANDFTNILCFRPGQQRERLASVGITIGT